MTREERENAIDIIQSILDKYEEDECLAVEITIGDEDIVALKIAIKALEQQPQTFEWCTDCREYDQKKHCCHRWSNVIRDTVEEMKQQPCEDAVSRQEVLSEVKSGMIRTIDGENWKRVNDNVRDIQALPPVTPQEPKVGHWIHTGGHNYHCSECDFIQHESMSEYKYCPNCGARMIEPQESEG